MLVWYCFRQTRNWVRHVSLHRPLAAPTKPEPDDVLNPRQQWPLASRPNSFWKRSIRSSNTPDALTDTTMTTSSSSTTTTIDDEDIFVCLYGLLLLLQIYFSSVLNSINTLVTHTNTQKTHNFTFERANFKVVNWNNPSFWCVAMFSNWGKRVWKETKL